MNLLRVHHFYVPMLSYPNPLPPPASSYLSPHSPPQSHLYLLYSYLSFGLLKVLTFCYFYNVRFVTTIRAEHIKAFCIFVVRCQFQLVSVTNFTAWRTGVYYILPGNNIPLTIYVLRETGLRTRANAYNYKGWT